MKRFMSSRSSSQQELQPVEDLRAERAAIALSVGLSWPPDRYTKTPRGRPSRQQLWERAPQDHIMKLPQGISLQRPAWWRPGEAIDRPLTHEEIAIVKTPCAAPAAAPVEDGPSSSASKRRKIHVDPIARDCFLDKLDQWKTERRWDKRRCLCEVQRLCPGVFDGIDPNTPYRWKPTALRRGRLPQLQKLHPGAGEHHACPLRPRWLVRRLGHEQGMAAPVFGRMGISRSRGPLREEPGVDDRMESLASTQRRRVRSCRRSRHRAPRRRRALLSRHIEPEPAPEDVVDWAMAVAIDGEDDAPMPDAPPPAPASAPPMTNLERCIALRLAYGAGPR